MAPSFIQIDSITLLYKFADIVKLLVVLIPDIA